MKKGISLYKLPCYLTAVFTLFLKEMNDVLCTRVFYATVGCFVVVENLLLWVLPETNVFDRGYVSLDALFHYGPYVFMVLIPALTMHSFALEKKTASLDVLLSLPIGHWHIVLGKYMVSCCVVCVMLTLTLPSVLTIFRLADPIGNLDVGILLGSYVGLGCLASLFAAVGILCSACTEHLTIAFSGSALSCFLVYEGFDAWSRLQSWSSHALPVLQLSAQEHYFACCRGALELYHVSYFALSTLFLLFCTKSVLRWSQS